MLVSLVQTQEMLPLVSVIVPSYNHEDYIELALTSILEQTYENIELIVIDDGSRDRSVERIEAVAHVYGNSRIQFIYRSGPHENQGAAATINEGLKLASGNFLTVLNSDDFYKPDRVEKLVKKLSALGSKPALAFSAVHQIDSIGESLRDDDPYRAWYLQGLRTTEKWGRISLGICKHNLAMTSGNLFFNRPLLEKLGGFGSFRTVHDYDFLLRSLFFTEPLFVDEELLYYRHHDQNNFEKSKPLMAKEIWLMATQFFQKIKLEAKPENQNAPWLHPHREMFQQFLATEQSVLTSILGYIPAIQ
jgi:glycosyltransferase involved in cell wall biosynthesis